MSNLLTEFNFSIKAEKVEDFTKRIKALAGVSNYIKFVLYKDLLFAFSQIGDGDNVDGFMSYEFDKEYFETYPEIKVGNNFFIFQDGKKFSTSFKFFAKNEILNFKLIAQTNKELCHSLEISDNKLLMPFTTGMPQMMTRISKDEVADYMESDTFEIVEMTFDQVEQVKKLIAFSANPENETMKVVMKKGKVKFSNGWTLDVCACNTTLDRNFFLKAKYFSEIDIVKGGKINFRLYELKAGVEIEKKAYYLFPLDIV